MIHPRPDLAAESSETSCLTPVDVFFFEKLKITYNWASKPNYPFHERVESGAGMGYHSLCGIDGGPFLAPVAVALDVMCDSGGAITDRAEKGVLRMGGRGPE